MSARLVLLAALTMAFAVPAYADGELAGGVKYECVDGVCRIVEDTPPAVASSEEPNRGWRVAQGYMGADEFIAFLRGESAAEPPALPASSAAFWAAVLAAVLGGLAMNLTPCVLPMVPVNLMIIGRSAARGAMYSLGIIAAYGAMGALATTGGMAFGEIQGSPWFNAGACVLFAALALAAGGVFHLDFSKHRGAIARSMPPGLPWLFAFAMGAVSAVLAGACVAPVLVGVLVLSARMYADGAAGALALPFAFGVGMALPWPFLGAGLRVLPKPGAWMRVVRWVTSAAVLALAAWYGRIAWIGFSKTSDIAADATPATISEVLKGLESSSKPVLVDCWATWCKNCTAMERVMDEPRVKAELESFTVLRLQAEDLSELRRVPGFGWLRGLPAFVVIGGTTNEN